jgi:hypothetical protein
VDFVEETVTTIITVTKERAKEIQVVRTKVLQVCP